MQPTNFPFIGDQQVRPRKEPETNQSLIAASWGDTFLPIHLLRINDPDDPQHISEVKQLNKKKKKNRNTVDHLKTLGFCEGV